MTPTPPSTTPSSASGPSPDAQQFRVTRKRNRVPLSCAPCRNRKLKCNRSHPCENCVRRGDASSCSYASPGARKKSQTQGASSPDDMQNRIDRLEGLVLSLMTNGSQSAGPAAANAAISRSQSDSVGSSAPIPTPYDDDMIKEEEDEDESETERVTNSLGVLKVDETQGRAMYLGESHWHLVLADIAEVKNYFIAHKKDIDKKYETLREAKPSNIANAPVFLVSSHETASDVELRGELPPKSTVEKLVARFFNLHDPAIHILHSPDFYRRLQVHWLDPSKTSIVWLGLLYSVMCMAMQSYHKASDEPVEWRGRSQELASEYRLRTVQCLVNSDYTKSSINTIETLILYVIAETAVEADVGLWVIVGIIVRLSMRMGYHRDPSNYGIVSFGCEMRRRIWTVVRQMDILYSFQLALPSAVRSSDCDTALPRNLFTDEFRIDSKTLPPSRPLTEPTPMSFFITQAQITFEFGEIVEAINSVARPVSYEEILRFDNRLRELKDSVAPHLRLRPMSQSTQDPATLVLQRFQIDIMWHKTVVVLHRKYIARARQNPRYVYSRRVSVESSMAILRHQAELHAESQPDRKLESMKWIVNNLNKHDFLLGAMVVCLDLNYDAISSSMSNPTPGYDPEFWSVEQRTDMLNALEHSLVLWKAGIESSMEAYKATNILEIMLQKLRNRQSGTKDQVPMSGAGPQGSTTAEVFAQFDEQDLKPEHSAAMTLGMLSGGLTPNTAAFLNSIAPSPGGGRYGNLDMNMTDPSTSSSGGTGLTPNYGMDSSNLYATMGNNNAASPFSVFGNMGGGGGGMLDAPVNLDWEAWDQYIQNGSAMDPNFQFYNTNLDPNLELSPTQQQQQQHPQNNQNSQEQNQGYSNSVFMGASGNTPGR